jgi:hypothetical protein
MKLFEVQTRFINIWENVFTENDKPLLFSSIKEAQLEIDDLVMHHDYSIDDYRIVEIIK